MPAAHHNTTQPLTARTKQEEKNLPSTTGGSFHLRHCLENDARPMTSFERVHGSYCGQAFHFAGAGVRKFRIGKHYVLSICLLVVTLVGLI